MCFVYLRQSFFVFGQARQQSGIDGILVLKFNLEGIGYFSRRNHKMQTMSDQEDSNEFLVSLSDCKIFENFNFL